MKNKQEITNIPSNYDPEDATIINISPGGYCLRLDGILPKQLQTGEIIGLLETNKNTDDHIWNIGSVRWIQRHDMGNLLLGVQLMAPDSVPVYARLATLQEDDHSFQRCLLLPALAGINQPASILTSQTPFSVNRLVTIKDNGKLFNIRLIRLISSGHGYKQFEYEETSDAKKENVGPINFDSVWDSL